MPSRYAAAVTCPSCGTRFQTPVEQILDVRVDPAAKNRAISGMINVAQCPQCGTGGALNLPFIYHDPEQEIALLYLPVESGSNEVERQQAAGRLTRELMDAMPPEERKGYLLQPETFINMDSFVKRVLELEGISEEDMERSQKQREFIGELIQASEDEWGKMLEENASLVDEGLFAFLEYVMQMVAGTGQETEESKKIEALHTYLVEATDLGQELARRTEVVRRFAQDPSRDTLVEALVDAPDDETVGILVQSGIGMMDYAFFQKLIQRIDEAESPDEQDRLRKLRRKILDLRDEMMEASENLTRDRDRLLNNLLATDDPVRMAQSHLSELDDLFFAVLGAQVEEAQQAGDEEAVEDLQKVAAAVNQVMEGTMPPEIALTRRLLAVTSDEELERQLEAHSQRMTPRFMQFLEALQAQMSEQGQDEAVERLAYIQAKAQKYVTAPEAAAAQPPAPPQGRPQGAAQQTAAAEEDEGDGEERTPSGLIIAKR